MIKVGIISFSDGRKRVHESLKSYIKETELSLKKELENTGEIKIYCANEIVYNSALAISQAKNLIKNDIDAVIINIPVFAFPNFPVISIKIMSLPCLVFSQKNPSFPGLGGLQAAVNMIRQVGLKCEKVWGDIKDKEILNKILSFTRAAHAASTLKGQTLGLIGGRSIGMGSGSVNPDLLLYKFGIDVEHVDQLEIIRRLDNISKDKVNQAYSWLIENVGSINFDNDKLTSESLNMQIKSYFATKEIVSERNLDFIAVKCHYELSEYYVTQCLSASFFNDPYDWEGPKDTMVFACEADVDAALTMQVMKLVSGKPVLFMDFRHFDYKENLLTLCNCGAMSTWYAQRSDNYKENLKSVNLTPVISKYAGKGCHVQYIAREGEMTLARFTRILGQYKLTIIKARCVKLSQDKIKDTTPNWPHCFIKLPIYFDELLENFDNNHIHAVYGNYVTELEQFCKLEHIDFNTFK